MNAIGMTVGELVAALKKFDPDKKVVFRSLDNDFFVSHHSPEVECVAHYPWSDEKPEFWADAVVVFSEERVDA